MEGGLGLDMDAARYENNAEVEMIWAMKAQHQAETYFKLISAMDASRLRLTKYDDDIYRQFKRYFKTLKVDVIRVEDFKSEDAKLVATILTYSLGVPVIKLREVTVMSEVQQKWRPFCNMYEGKVEDFNFGTLLRIDCNKGYDEENTILVTRIQFYAVEIARNRRGLNKHLSEKPASTEALAEER